jgi:hypothetical protein
MKLPGHAVAVLLLAAGLVGCKPAGPLDGLSEKELRAAQAQALIACNNNGRIKATGGDLMVALGDLIAAEKGADRKRIAIASNALIRERGCVAQ